MAGITATKVQGKFDIGDIYSIAITKAKAEIEVNTGDLPPESYVEIFALGLKTFLNKGMGDVKTKDLQGDALAKAQAEALKFGQDNLAKLLSGEFKKSASKQAKVTGKVMTEARRLARNWAKDTYKANKGRVSDVTAAEWTRAANALIDNDPSWVKMAEESLAQAAQQKSEIDIKAFIKVDPNLVAKADAKKKEKKPLSATQAGIVAPRQRPGMPQGGQVRH